MLSLVYEGADARQFTQDEDDLYDILNDSLNREDIGQASLDEQFDLGGEADHIFGDPETGLPTPTMYEFSESIDLELLPAVC